MAPGSIHPLLSCLILWRPQTPLFTAHSPLTLSQALAPGAQFIQTWLFPVIGSSLPILHTWNLFASNQVHATF